METVAQAKSKFFNIQIVLALCLAILIFCLRWFVFNQFDLALWSGLVLFLEITLGGRMLWSVFQFYQPQRTLSFNPILILIMITLSVGYAFYFGMAYVPWVDSEELYSVGFPFHLLSLFFVFWILFYEWWFFKNDIRNQQSTKRLLMMQDDLKNSEIKNIQQHVQPHFLFNSLNSINSLILADQFEAQKMVVELSDFLRHSVLKNQKMFVSLKEEIDQIKRYFSIEKIRFTDRLSYEILHKKEDDQIQIPSMILQPLVENAIKHGLYGQINQTHIELIFRREKAYLIVEMKNPYEPTMIKKKGTGFGLNSVRKKLYWLFAENHLLETKTDDQTFITCLKIPLKDESSINR
jgi:two-component system LytT family sensor kinase